MFAITSWNETLSSVDLWWWAIAAGFLSLMFTVLILARLRVIHTRPLRACVVLSVLAHLLFLGSATLLRLFDIPQFPGDNTIQFQITLDDETVEKQEAEQPVEQPKTQRTPPKPAITQVVPPEPTPPLPELFELALSAPSPALIPETVPDRLTPIDELAITPALEVDKLLLEPPLAITTNPPEPPRTPDEKPLPELQPELRLRPQTVVETPNTIAAAEVASIFDDLDATETPDSKATTDEYRMVDVPSPTVDEGNWQSAQPKPAPVHSKYQLRDLSQRSVIAKRRGGTKSTEEAVEAALNWLVRNQERDGSWNASRHHAGRGGYVEGQLRQTTGIRADTGVSGLALLALLGGGHTHQRGPYQKHVQVGLEYLMSQQRNDGCMGGPAGSFAQMYCHGIAALALCEAYGMTKDPRLESFTRRAVEYTVRSQHQTTGGWRYFPGDPGDTSQFGWQLMVVESALEAGIDIPTKTRELTRRFLSHVASGTYDGLAAYRPGKAPTASMTAEALACRAYLGHVDNRLVNEASNYIIRYAPTSSHRNLYFWYYGTLALYQLDAEHWSTWNTALHNALIPTQRRRGKLAGSWDTDTVWGGCGGRVYTTAMAALCLEVYYRYVPVRRNALARRPG